MDVLTKVSLLAFSFFLSGCQITYLMKSAYNQMSILYQREPIDKALNSDSLSKPEKDKLFLVQEVRAFASENLKLNVGKNYSTYVQLKKPYPVWAVNASPKWKLKHYLWHFPIVGSVPYKGFPNEVDAKEEEKELQKKGYDTYVRGVSAYSTLGWFNDPILSSMLRYKEEDLVNTVIHESVHATLYIKSHADFNERLATFIGDKGTELFYEMREGKNSPHLIAIKNGNQDQKIFSQFISEEIKKLNQVFKNHPQEDLALREEQYNEMKKRFRDEIKSQLKTTSYENFDKRPLNNARLLLFKTYIEDLSEFQTLFDKLNGDLPLFINKIKTLESHKDPVEGLKSL